MGGWVDGWMVDGWVDGGWVDGGWVDGGVGLWVRLFMTELVAVSHGRA
jgi:hypothetical protein